MFRGANRSGDMILEPCVANLQYQIEFGSFMEVNTIHPLSNVMLDSKYNLVKHGFNVYFPGTVRSTT